MDLFRTSLNLSVAESLLLGCHPVIVEGASDQHYLTAIKVLLIGAGKLTPKRELVFPPSGGAKTVKIVASMLLGRDDSLPVVLLDSDEPGKRMFRELSSELYLDAKDKLLQVSTYVGFDGAEIEDLIPPEIFAAVVDRWARPDTPFTDIVESGKPVLPQVEAWARQQGVELHQGWKVDLAKRAKQYVLGRGISAINDRTIQIWVRLFEDFGNSDK